MHLRIVLAIALKDLKSAVRDGRVLLALLMPLGLGVFYNLVMPENQKPAVKVAIFAAEPSRLPDQLNAVAGATVNLSIHQSATAADAVSLVKAKKVDAAILIPAGFDAQVAAGSTPAVTIAQPSSGATAGATFTITSVNAAVREMAGQRPPATVALEPVAVAPSAGALGSLTPRTYTILGALMLLIAMIAIYVIPVLLTEEYEKRTADTLLLIGENTDIVAAKALVGFAFAGLAVTIFLAATRIPIANPGLFLATVAALAVTLIGYGLLMGGLARTVAQLNTWSSVPLLLLIMPPFFAAFGFPNWVQTILDATPGMQAMHLFVDGASTTVVHGNWITSFAVIAAWAAAGYGLLVVSLSRREA